MFTIEQIKEAHDRVTSGADFPAYIQDLKKLGVISYTVFVADGHTDYRGADNYSTSSPESYERLAIAVTSNKEQFTTDLRVHQSGKTDYLTFCADAARSGVEKWTVDIAHMTCTYLDKAENIILVEEIPV